MIGVASALHGGATVNWTAPANSGSSPITGYTVTSSPAGGTAKAGPNDTKVSVMGLTNGTAYTFTVTATNAVGTGAASAASNAVTPLSFQVYTPPGGFHFKFWKPMVVAANGITFTPGVQYRFSIPTNPSLTFNSEAQKLLNLGFTMNAAYDDGATLPSDWPSTDPGTGRWRYDVTMFSGSPAYNIPSLMAQAMIQHGTRIYQYA